MKNLVFSLIVLVSLAFSNVGFALPDVSTEKANTELMAVADTPDVFGIYEVVKTQAPEVFTDDAGGTKVTLYGKYKDEAFKYLTEQKNGKNIYTSADCFKDKQIAVSICRDNKTAINYNYNYTKRRAYPNTTTNLTLSGFSNKIAKKWVRSI